MQNDDFRCIVTQYKELFLSFGRNEASLEGINSSSKVIDTDIIAPRSLARFMRKYSKENSDVIKIDNPQEFIKDLLNTFKNEKKD